MSYNKFMILGRVGRDPDNRYLADGTLTTNFSVAVKDAGKDDDGNPATMWVRVVAYDRLAESVSRYVRRGRRVFVEGKILVDKKTGNPAVFSRKDGTVGTALEMRASNVVYLDDQSDFGVDGQGEAAAVAQEQPPTPPMPDEPPF